MTSRSKSDGCVRAPGKQLGRVLLGLMFAWAGLARADEVVVQNDSITQGSTAAVCPCFDAGESAAAWLTSPCNGSIVAVQIFWRSFFGGQPQSLEEHITIFAGGTFPVPGGILEFLEGPVLTDGALNEFRYIDEQSSIPIDVPISTGQVFVVSLNFGVTNANQLEMPSVVYDQDGCQPGKNAVLLNTDQWVSACSLGVTGDWFIRAVVDCQEPTGACCNADAMCANEVIQSACQDPGETFFIGQLCSQVTCPAPTGACCPPAGGCFDAIDQVFCEETVNGVYSGNGSLCSQNVCVKGACCDAGGACSEVVSALCQEPGQAFNGPGTSCSPNPCPQPTGACCLGSSCVPSPQTQAACTGGGGTWAGPFTSCFPDICPICDDGDVDGDGDVDLVDAAELQHCIVQGTAAGSCKCLDMNNDSLLTSQDVELFAPALNASGPQ